MSQALLALTSKWDTYEGQGTQFLWLFGELGAWGQTGLGVNLTLPLTS